MRPKSQFRILFYGSQPPTFSAWTMAIVFITVAMLSFAIDQAVILSPAESRPDKTCPRCSTPFS